MLFFIMKTKVRDATDALPIIRLGSTSVEIFVQ